MALEILALGDGGSAGDAKRLQHVPHCLQLLLTPVAHEALSHRRRSSEKPLKAPSMTGARGFALMHACMHACVNACISDSILTPSAFWPPEPFWLTPDYTHK